MEEKKTNEFRDARSGVWEDGSATNRNGNSKRRSFGMADGMVRFHDNDFGMLLGNLSSS